VTESAPCAGLRKASQYRPRLCLISDDGLGREYIYYPLTIPLFEFLSAPLDWQYTMLRRISSTVPRRVVAARPSNVHIRNIAISAQRMSALKPLQNPISAALPSDSFQLLPESEKSGAAEDALYEQQLKDVESWWASPRYEGIKRPYSAADVVSKRGSQMQSYPSSVMARKLFNLIREREAKGEPIHTSMSILLF
jgi:isocitrate lyase